MNRTTYNIHIDIKKDERINMNNEEKSTDINNIDFDTLVDMETIKIDPNLPKQERIEQYLHQIKNPYCFKVGEVVVSVSYSEDDVTLQERIEQYLQNL